MGYILPITHYQYTQYANRTLRTVKSPFVLQPVNKSSLENKLHHKANHELLDFSDREETHHNESFRNKNTQIKAHVKIDYQLVSEITGKGVKFNEYI